MVYVTPRQISRVYLEGVVFRGSMRHKYTDDAIFITVKIVLFPDKKLQELLLPINFLAGQRRLTAYKFITKEKKLRTTNLRLNEENKQKRKSSEGYLGSESSSSDDSLPQE